MTVKSSPVVFLALRSGGQYKCGRGKLEVYIMSNFFYFFYFTMLIYTTFSSTLRYSYIGWSKYKTAKPLRYTVYRIRNRKQLGKKWLGKVISFEAVPRNSWHGR